MLYGVGNQHAPVGGDGRAGPRQRPCFYRGHFVEPVVVHPYAAAPRAVAEQYPAGQVHGDGRAVRAGDCLIDKGQLPLEHLDPEAAVRIVEHGDAPVRAGRHVPRQREGCRVAAHRVPVGAVGAEHPHAARVAAVVGHDDVAAGADGDAGYRPEIRAGARPCGPERQGVRVVGMEHRHAVIAPVGDDDAPVWVDGYVVRSLELPLAGAARAERVHVDAARVEHDDPVVARVGYHDPAVWCSRGAPGAAEPPVLGPGVPELAGVGCRKGRRGGGGDRRLRMRRREQVREGVVVKGAAAVPGAPRCERGDYRVVVPRQGARVPRRRGGVVPRPVPAAGRAQCQGGGVRHEEYEAAQDGQVPVTAEGAPPPPLPRADGGCGRGGGRGRARRRTGSAPPPQGKEPPGAAYSHGALHPAPCTKRRMQHIPARLGGGRPPYIANLRPKRPTQPRRARRRD